MSFSELIWIPSSLYELVAKSRKWNPSLHARSKHRSKHEELQVYFVHERVAEGKPEMNYVPGEGEEQVAYILTKPLAVGAFAYLARNLESDL